MADEKQNSQDFEDDLLADFHIAQAKKSAPLAAAQTPSQSSDSGGTDVKTDSDKTPPPRKPRPVQRPAADMPRKPDGTPYSIAELRQNQASRQTGRDRMTPYGELPQARPLPPRQDPRRQSERTRQQSAYDAAYYQQNPGQKKPVYRHRKMNKPNGALVLFAVLVLLVGGISIGQIVRNRSAAGEENNLPAVGQTDILTGEDTAAAETNEPEPEELVLWNTTQIDNSLLDDGSLILVNYQYPYADADTIPVKDVYGNKNQYYQVSSTSITLTGVALDAMNTMTEAFHTETGSDDMIIVSGYRNVQSQRDIYNDRVATQGEEMAALYVATPGYSEHHTGLAMDLSFYTDEGKSVSIEEYEHGLWINENCAKYGFVLRYPSDKVGITKIGYEFWHYRYVGLPHATIMSEKLLCLEEYIEYIKQYTTDTKLLWIQPGGLMADVSATALPIEGTLVYYVPASEGETTDVRIPRGNIFQNTEISGNNVDGFIVTVHIGS
ncbi:MAG: D-alanyl-D-alanine carboxypeptidase family protein [Ruminococcaceae bacterium]|nr:D-alanyl-D-alanine carboxypeptidase family protein [Oscillospiraceae bacterium]